MKLQKKEEVMGGGVLAGIKKSKNEYILCIDSDGQCLPDSFNKFWEDREKANVLIGIRYPRKDPILRIVYSNLFLILHRILFPSDIKRSKLSLYFGQKRCIFEIN